MLRRSITAASIVFVAGTALAQAQGKQGYVITSDGQKIEGEITEKNGKVIVKKAGGITLEFDASQAKAHYDAGSPAEGDANAKRRWVEIEKKDGGTIRGEVVDEKADSITIKPRGQAPITFKLSEAKVTQIEDMSAAAEADLGDRYVDYEARYQIERPSAEWKLRKSTSPETRALMVLVGKDAFVAVSVKPVATVNPAYLDPTKESAKRLQAEVEADLKADLERYSGIQLDVSELFGAPVVEARYEGNYPSEATAYQFIELRFVRDGLLYSVRAAGEKKNTFKEVEPKLREAFTSFSFIAPQGGDDDGYNDLVKGFGIDRPSLKWTIDARPFDEKEPVTIRNEDGRAELRVLSMESGGRSAAQYLDEYLKALGKQDDFKSEKKSDTRSGYSVETYHATYFEGRSAKKCDEQGMVVVINDTRIVHAIGVAPFADADAKDLQREVAKALENFKIFDPKRKRLGDGARAVEEYTKGVEAAKKKQWTEALSFFNEAIKLYRDYARAYFWRAAVNIEQKAWKEYRADLDHVMDLDPRPETAARAAQLYLAEAQARVKDRQWPDACKAWKEAVRADPKNEKLRKDFIRFYQEWWNDLKRTAGPKGMKEAVEDIEEHRWTDKEFEPVLATMFAEAGQQVLSQDRKQFQKARSLATKALSYDRDCKAAKEVVKQCDEAKKQLESQPKKK